MVFLEITDLNIYENYLIRQSYSSFIQLLRKDDLSLREIRGKKRADFVNS